MISKPKLYSLPKDKNIHTPYPIAICDEVCREEARKALDQNASSMGNSAVVTLIFHTGLPISIPGISRGFGPEGHPERTCLMLAINQAIKEKREGFKDLKTIRNTNEMENAEYKNALQSLSEIKIYTERKSCDYYNKQYPEQIHCDKFFGKLFKGMNNYKIYYSIPKEGDMAQNLKNQRHDALSIIRLENERVVHESFENIEKIEEINLEINRIQTKYLNPKFANLEKEKQRIDEELNNVSKEFDLLGINVPNSEWILVGLNNKIQRMEKEISININDSNAKNIEEKKENLVVLQQQQALTASVFDLTKQKSSIRINSQNINKYLSSPMSPVPRVLPISSSTISPQKLPIHITEEQREQIEIKRQAAIERRKKKQEERERGVVIVHPNELHHLREIKHPISPLKTDVSKHGNTNNPINQTSSINRPFHLPSSVSTSSNKKVDTPVSNSPDKNPSPSSMTSSSAPPVPAWPISPRLSDKSQLNTASPLISPRVAEWPNYNSGLGAKISPSKSNNQNRQANQLQEIDNELKNLPQQSSAMRNISTPANINNINTTYTKPHLTISRTPPPLRGNRQTVQTSTSIPSTPPKIQSENPKKIMDAGNTERKNILGSVTTHEKQSPSTGTAAISQSPWASTSTSSISLTPKESTRISANFPALPQALGNFSATRESSITPNISPNKNTNIDKLKMPISNNINTASISPNSITSSKITSNIYKTSTEDSRSIKAQITETSTPKKAPKHEYTQQRQSDTNEWILATKDGSPSKLLNQHKKRKAEKTPNVSPEKSQLPIYPLNQKPRLQKKKESLRNRDIREFLTNNSYAPLRDADSTEELNTFNKTQSPSKTQMKSFQTSKEIIDLTKDDDSRSNVKNTTPTPKKNQNNPLMHFSNKLDRSPTTKERTAKEKILKDEATLSKKNTQKTSPKSNQGV